MKWSRKHTLIAGVALIAATNAVALIGVAYNRNGEPESELRLTQRELAPPYWRGNDTESSGLELGLQWRTLSKEDNGYYEGGGGPAEWLDRAKLEALGFDLRQPADSLAGRRHHARVQSKQVFVALELDGPAYQEAVQRAQRLADAPATQRTPDSGMNTPAQRLLREQTSASRLFAVDAALDPAELRIRYPDRSRYAIVRGSVSADYYRESAASSGQSSGRLSDVFNGRISVPLEFRPAFDSLPRTPPVEQATTSRFDVTVAFGKRFEPWIVAAANRKDKAE